MRKVLSFLIIFLFFATPASSAILFYEDFEDELDVIADPDRDWVGESEGTGSKALSSEQVRAGSNAYKFSCTGSASARIRQEFCIRNPFNNGSIYFDYGDERWIGFSVFLASGYYSPSDPGTWGPVHQQYHCVLDTPPTCVNECCRAQPLQIRTHSGDWQSVIGWDEDQCTEDGEGDYSLYTTYSSYTVGVWVDFVMHVIWDYTEVGGNGLTQIWKDGVLILDRSGPNCFNDLLGPYLKIGIYGWLNEDQILTIYYDELRVGDNNSSYAEVAPGGCTLPTVTTQAVTDITTTTAIGHGTITNTGGENATKRGICWNTTGSPTIADDNVTEIGNFSTGAFSGNMTGLTPDQAYFVRALAYNTGGYGYSSTEGYNTDADANGTYIIDDGDNGTSSTGTWSTSGGANPYGTSSLYCHAVNSTYTYEKTLDGNYTVSLWWTEYASRSSSVTVKIYDSGDNLLDTKSVNQTTLGGQWNTQDTYDFNATAKVTILSTGGGPPNVSTCADAVKFDYVEGSGGEDVNDPSRLYGINLLGCEMK